MLLNIFIGLLGLSIVVIVHEYGHYIFAKIYGIGVEVFSIGWGSKLVGKKIGNTEYRISMIPIGGYVKLSGMNMLHPDREQNISNNHTSRDLLFNNAHPLKRIMIALGGPLANILFAFFIFVFLNSLSYSYFAVPNKIVNASVLDGTIHPGERAGLENGDVIIDINGIPVSDFRDIQSYVQNSRSTRELSLTVVRNNRQLVIDITSRVSDRLIGIYPWIEPIVMDIEPGSLAETIGIEPYDTITFINNMPVRNTIDIDAHLLLIDRLETISVLRNGNQMILEYPHIDTTNSSTGELGTTYISDVARAPAEPLSVNIRHSMRSIGSAFASTIQGIASLFSTKQQIESVVAGPIQITSIIGNATLNSTTLGLWNSVRVFLNLVALISIAIAIMNLLPIPILDGGQIILYVLELLVFKKLTAPVVKAYQLTGYGIILILLCISIFSDISFILQ